ncbi:MAG: DUF2959 family protein [Balneolaceae bacterium]
MKTFTTTGIFWVILFLVGSFTLSGCASSSGLERSEAIQTSMDRVDENVESITTQVNSVNSALNELTRQGQGDIRGAYDRFSEEVSELREMERDFESNAEEMESDAENYFEGWTQTADQYENPELQRRSEERRDELSQRYEQISQNSQTVKEILRSYVSDVNEIESYLSNDLTSQGINSIAGISNDAVDEGEQLRTELNSLQSAIASVRDEMRQGGITMN